MEPETLVTLAALIYDALQELAGERTPAAVLACGRLHAAARIIGRADRHAAEQLREEMQFADAYLADEGDFDGYGDMEDLPF